MTTIRWPWKPEAHDSVVEGLMDADRARPKIADLERRTDEAVGRIIQIRRENHLGETFQTARHMRRRPWGRSIA